MINKFNVILLHIGICDERKFHYPELYSKCFESIKIEFKNDNIIIFHSFEEIFKQFPQIEDQIKTKYAEFWETTTDFRYKTDLIRFLLISFYDNLLYLDADVFVYKNFRTDLIEQINKEIDNKYLYLTDDHANIFYCKHFFPELNLFLNTFTEDYGGDKSLIVLRDVDKVSYVHSLCFHFEYLWFLKKHITNKTKVYLINDASFFDDKNYKSCDDTLFYFINAYRVQKRTWER